MSAATYADLREHVGHQIETVVYGPTGDPANVAVECTTCSIVLLDFDAPTGDPAPSPEPACGNDHTFALWFTPDAIRDHYDGDEAITALLNAVSDDTLSAAATGALTSDSLYREFHRLCEEIVADVVDPRR